MTSTSKDTSSSRRPLIINVACGLDFLVAEAEEGLWVLGDSSKRATGQPTMSFSQPLFRLKDALKDLLHAWLSSEGVILIDWQGGVFSSLWRLHECDTRQFSIR